MSPSDIRQVFAFTGHRPPKLGGYHPTAQEKLVAFAKRTLAALDRNVHPIDRCIVGMALGWDMAVAQACVDMNIAFTAAIPFPQQPDRWPAESRLRYERLLSKAFNVHQCGDSYHLDLMQTRNEWMVDHAGVVVALYDGSPGGTRNCVEYARIQKKPVLNAWREWSVQNAGSTLVSAAR